MPDLQPWEVVESDLVDQHPRINWRGPCVDSLLAQREAACRRIAELEQRALRALEMLEDDQRFGDQAHDARREVWNTLAGEVKGG